MKFGMEAEKFLFDLRSERPSNGVFRFLDALSDFRLNHYHTLGDNKTTNEFVLNMVEFGTTPSESPLEVLKDYFLHYLMLRRIALREQVALVPMGSLPMNYLPHMTPKWAYFVQNSVLAGARQNSWMMEETSPLRYAGNCAGIHVHTEVETPPEFLFSNRELQDKFNLGLALTPMIAFSSSPYSYGKHSGRSMRGLTYYEGVYKEFPLHGGLPPVMNSSVEVLNYVRRSGEEWVARGTSLGFEKHDMDKLIVKSSANWNPVRWNRHWNTIELRCLDSSTIDMDAGKFMWICAAMKRSDIQGEALQCAPIKTKQALDKKMIEECFKVSGKEVCILPTDPMRELFHRSMVGGTKDPLVESYLHAIGTFAEAALEEDQRLIFKGLKQALNTHNTTSEWILGMTGGQPQITNAEAVKFVTESIQRENKIIAKLRPQAPDIFQLLEEMTPTL